MAAQLSLDRCGVVLVGRCQGGTAPGPQPQKGPTNASDCGSDPLQIVGGRQSPATSHQTLRIVQNGCEKRNLNFNSSSEREKKKNTKKRKQNTSAHSPRQKPGHLLPLQYAQQNDQSPHTSTEQRRQGVCREIQQQLPLFGLSQSRRKRRSRTLDCKQPFGPHQHPN